VSLFHRKSRQADPADLDGDTAHVEDAAHAEGVAHAEEMEEAAPEPVDDRPSGGLSERGQGPWDVSEVPDEAEGYLDLGALRLTGRDGMELRLDLEEETGRVTSATVQLGQSSVQLQVFAAPRTSGIWDEIRTEIAAGITRQGGTVDDVPGPFGRELLARIPAPQPDGRLAQQPARFTGVDGPRWFLRAVFHGRAAFDHEAAAALESVVRDVVVVRGVEAMAPRELLSLRLPSQPGSQPPGPEGEDSSESLEPFRRGPEITEIR